MGNDDKIDKSLVPSGSRFLPEEIQNFDDEGQIYNLEQEYAKTKKNKNYKLYFFIFLFVAFAAGCAFLFSRYLEMKDRSYSVSIKEFDDVRLKEVLGSARKSESNIEIMQIQLQILQVEMLDAILNAKKEFLRKRSELISKDLPVEETDRLIKELETGVKRDSDRITRQYEARIASQRAQMEQAERKRAQEMNQLKDSQQGKMLSNEDRVYKIKLDTLRKGQKSGIEAMRKYYDNNSKYIVMQYNPLFSSGKIASILASELENLPGDESFLKNYDSLLQKEAGFSKKQFESLHGRISDDLFLLKRLQRIDYKNSIPGVLKKIDNLSRSIIRDYETLWSTLVDIIMKKNEMIEARNKQLKSYYYPFNHVLEQKADQGYIVDPRDTGNIVVHMNKAVEVEEGEAASVFRGKERIARIQLQNEGGSVSARLISIEPKKKLAPLDRIDLENKKKSLK